MTSTEKNKSCLSCSESMIKNVLRALCTDRGSFYPDKGYGAGLKAAADKAKEAIALGLARRAVYNMNGVYIISADETKNGFNFSIIINNCESEVFVPVEYYI